MARLLTLFIFTVLWIPTTLWAQEGTTLTLPERPDVRIIVDISGSMKETDPNNLRQPAVRLLARVIPEGSTAGVWTFGQYVNMLVPHGEVVESWRQTALDRSQQINSVALRTNLGKAIEVASDDYVTGGTLENTHFILLTDGKVDISDSADVNRAEETRILGKLVDGLVAKGATFHPVALSRQADAGFLKTLAEKSKGSFHLAETADSLNLAFLDALNTAAPQEQIPIEGNAFVVDSGVKEFTALIFTGQNQTSEAAEPAVLELVRPDGEVLKQAEQPDNVRWASEVAYNLVTITDPQAGEWRVTGELGEGSRVTVVSDLRMIVAPIPATFTSKSPVDVRVAFFEKEEKVINPEFLDVISVTLGLTAADGRSGSKTLSPGEPPEDGEYTDSISVLPTPGLYRIDIVADGKTFARKFSATTEFMVPVGMVESTIEAPIDISMAETAEPAPEPEMPVETKPEGEPEPADEPEPVAEAAEPDQDVLDEPQQETAPEESSELPVPLWMMGAGAGALLVFALLILLVIRKRRSASDAGDAVDEEAESLDDLKQEMESFEAETPVVMPEPEPEPEAVAVPVVEPEQEDIPIAQAVVEPEEAIPELTEPAEDDGEEEFALDDFDLSEFDDLPDFDDLDEKPDDEQKK
ncbi:VWA domain-containing protein [Marinobacter salexigens]|uniref:VWA domain-containing protein n=1 Tax=Marinobacter salexigens TaxID=1925763 RepID=UPI001EFEAB94|nr:vWA domain-containing protein [Marinobacter salexigens]